MARAVRFTKPERELIKRTFHASQYNINNWGTGVVKLASSILDKVAESEAPQERSTGLTVQDALAAFRSVLDRRLVPPLGNTYARIQAQLKSLGLTREQCIAAAEQAGRQWKGPIKAHSIVNQAETLLHNAESEPLPMEGRSYDETRSGMDDL